MTEKDQLTVRDRISKICEMETLSHSDSSFLKDPIYVQMSSLFWKGMTSAYYRKHDFVFQFFVENKKDEEVFNCLWELSTKNNKSELISEILITHLNSIRSSLFPLNGSSADTVSAKRRHEFLSKIPDKILSILETAKNESSFGLDVNSNQDLFSLKILFGESDKISPVDETTRLNLIKFNLSDNSGDNSNRDKMFQLNRAIEFWYEINKNYYKQAKLFEDKWNRLERGKGFLSERKELCAEILKYNRYLTDSVLNDILEQGYDSLKGLAVEYLLSDYRTAPKIAFAQAEVIFCSIKNINDVSNAVPRYIAQSIDKMGPLVMPNLGKTTDKYTARLVQEFFDKN